MRNTEELEIRTRDQWY